MDEHRLRSIFHSCITAQVELKCVNIFGNVYGIKVICSSSSSLFIKAGVFCDKISNMGHMYLHKKLFPTVMHGTLDMGEVPEAHSG